MGHLGRFLLQAMRVHNHNNLKATTPPRNSSERQKYISSKPVFELNDIHYFYSPLHLYTQKWSNKTLAFYFHFLPNICPKDAAKKTRDIITFAQQK